MLTEVLALPPRRPAACWPGRARTRPARPAGAGGRADAGRVPGRGRLLGVLHPALRPAVRRGGVVVPATDRAPLPGALPVRVPEPARPAVGDRLAALAHRAGRVAQLRRADHQGAGRGPDRRAGHRRAAGRRAALVTYADVDGTRTESYDGVVIATHPDQALRLLADPTPAERDVLGAFRYSVNETVLHTDAAAARRRRGAGVLELRAAARARRPPAPCGSATT